MTALAFRFAILPVAVFCFAATAAAQVASPTAGSPVPAESRQMVLVTTGGWNSSMGTLRRYERDGRSWRQVDEPVQIVVGRSGMGWGLGLHGAQSSGPVKKEGDGRAPAGVFRLTSAFGYGADMDTGLSYLRSTTTTDCVDDSESTSYNEVVDREETENDYSSHEQMLRDDGLYRVGVIVAHNGSGLHGTEGTPEPVAGQGSCIFLHVWSGPGSSTAGCTAMPEDRLRTIVAWLDEAHQPVLVQLPRREAMRLRRAWGLPNPS